MNKAYFSYLLKTKRLLILFFFGVYLSVSLIWNPLSGDSALGVGFYSAVRIAEAGTIGLAYVLPVMLFSFIHRRSSADLYFALPVSRRELRITNLVFAFAVSYGYYLITVFTAFLLYGHQVLSLNRLLLLLLYTAFETAAVLVIVSFIYLIGNNQLDGIVLLAAYTMAAAVAFLCEEMILENMVAGYSAFETGSAAAFLSPVFLLMNNGRAVLTLNGWPRIPFNWYYFAAAVCYACAAWYGLQVEIDRRKTERAEMISDHALAYPTVINLYAVLILLMLSSSLIKDRDTGIGFMYVLLLSCYIVGTFLYRRKMKIEWKQLVLFAGEMILSLALMALMWHTKGFGMAEKYSLLKGETLAYQYHMQTSIKDLGTICDGTEESASVDFELQIPTGELERFQDAVTILENYRSEQIDRYYQHNGGDTWSFLVYNKQGEKTVNSHYYEAYTALTEADLQVIGKYTDIYVSANTYPALVEEDLTLDQFLQSRAGSN